MKFNSNVSTAIKPAILLGLLVFYVYIIGSHLMNNSGAEGMQEGATNKAKALAAKAKAAVAKAKALAKSKADVAKAKALAKSNAAKANAAVKAIAKK